MSLRKQLNDDGEVTGDGPRAGRALWVASPIRISRCSCIRALLERVDTRFVCSAWRISCGKNQALVEHLLDGDITLFSTHPSGTAWFAISSTRCWGSGRWNPCWPIQPFRTSSSIRTVGSLSSAVSGWKSPGVTFQDDAHLMEDHRQNRFARRATHRRVESDGRCPSGRWLARQRHRAAAGH